MQISNWKVLLVEAGIDEPTGTQVPSMFLNFLGSSIDWGYLTEPEEMACLNEEEKRCYWPRGKVRIPNNFIFQEILHPFQIKTFLLGYKLDNNTRKLTNS